MMGPVEALDDAIDVALRALQNLGETPADREAVNDAFATFLAQTAPRLPELRQLMAQERPAGPVTVSLYHVQQACRWLADDEVARARSELTAARAALSTRSAGDQTDVRPKLAVTAGAARELDLRARIAMLAKSGEETPPVPTAPCPPNHDVPIEGFQA